MIHAILNEMYLQYASFGKHHKYSFFKSEAHLHKGILLFICWHLPGKIQHIKDSILDTRPDMCYITFFFIKFLNLTQVRFM